MAETPAITEIVTQSIHLGTYFFPSKAADNYCLIMKTGDQYSLQWSATEPSHALIPSVPYDGKSDDLKVGLYKSAGRMREMSGELEVNTVPLQIAGREVDVAETELLYGLANFIVSTHEDSQDSHVMTIFSDVDGKQNYVSVWGLESAIGGLNHFQAFYLQQLMSLINADEQIENKRNYASQAIEFLEQKGRINLREKVEDAFTRVDPKEIIEREINQLFASEKYLILRELASSLLENALRNYPPLKELLVGKKPPTKDTGYTQLPPPNLPDIEPDTPPAPAPPVRRPVRPTGTSGPRGDKLLKPEAMLAANEFSLQNMKILKVHGKGHVRIEFVDTPGIAEPKLSWITSSNRDLTDTYITTRSVTVRPEYEKDRICAVQLQSSTDKPAHVAYVTTLTIHADRTTLGYGQWSFQCLDRA